MLRRRWLGPAVGMAIVGIALYAAIPYPESLPSLRHGGTVATAVEGGQRQAYLIEAPAGRCFDLVLRVKGSPVAFDIQGPDGQPLLQIPIVADADHPERFVWMAEAGGTYRLEVRLDEGQPTASCTAQLSAPRTPRPEDRRLIEARRALDEGRFQEGLSLLEGLPEPLLRSRLLKSIGDTQVATNELSRAEATFREVAELRRPLGPYWAATGLINLGNVHAQRGEAGLAADCARSAIAWAQRSGSVSLLAKATYNAGTYHQDLQDFARALSYYEQSLPLLRERQDPATAAVLHGIGSIHLAMKKHGAALESFEQARTTAAADPLHMPTFLISSAVALGRMGRRTEAFARMEEVLGLLRPEDFAGHMRALEALGELHEADLQNEAAEARYREALDRLQPDAGQGDEWRPRMLLNLAAVLRSEGRLPEARAAAREARGILELARQAIRGEGSRLQYSARLDEASDIEVDVLMGMHEQDPRGGWERAALERTEESRGRVLRELLWEPATRPGSPAKAEVLAKAQEIRERLNAETSRQLRLSQSDVGGAAESVVKLSQLIAEYQEVRAETRAHRAREAEPRPFRVPDLQALVDADTTALVYDLGKARSHVWVLTSRSVASHVLPGRDHIEPLVAQLRTLVARERAGGNESSSDYDRLASHLSKTLLASLGPRPAGHRLVVIGDGALDTLPFAALPLPERWRSDAEAADSSRPLLMNAFEIVRLPSLSTVAALRRRHAGPPPPPAGSLAIIADPVFSHDDPRLRKLGPAPAAAGAMNAGADLPRLYLTRGLADLARDAPDRELGAFDFEASLGTVRSRGLAGYRTVIFATHALVNPQVPELSGLVLSLFDADAAPRNGVLTLQDVHDLDLHAELVVLAGCDTAMGKQIHGEGLITLSRGFLYAGARRVLATLWEVDEEATVALIKAFYGLVQRGHSHADALRRAQASLAENPRWRSPYYWAGFVLQGDWK